jgi:hypothetical protein
MTLLVASHIPYDSAAVYSPPHEGSALMITDDLKISKTSEDSVPQVKTKPKRCSRTYTFSVRDVRKYASSRAEGRLRFPDFWMYHISRSTDDVQREERLRRTQMAERVAFVSGLKVDVDVAKPVGMEEKALRIDKLVITHTEQAPLVVTHEPSKTVSQQVSVPVPMYAKQVPSPEKEASKAGIFDVVSRFFSCHGWK